MHSIKMLFQEFQRRHNNPLALLYGKALMRLKPTIRSSCWNNCALKNIYVIVY